ncbi:MAG: group III truncated hemoglobin [Janthinobacterium lividum]
MNPDLCSEQDIADLVHAFYAKVRSDALLGPVFNAHIGDWDHHLARIADFWSSVLLGTGRYTGTPMQKHAMLPELRPELFERWLTLFDETAALQPNRELATRAGMAARRIASSLWYGHQMARRPGEMPTSLPNR